MLPDIVINKEIPDREHYYVKMTLFIKGCEFPQFIQCVPHKTGPADNMHVFYYRYYYSYYYNEY